MSPDQLWRILKDLFDTDDGSLPEIHVLHLESREVPRAYELLRTSSKLVSKKAYIWDRVEGREVPLDDVPNAAELVVSGRAEGFHCVVGGLTIDGGVIPDLGVFVSPDALILDYKMGHEWDAAGLYALFGLIRRIVASSPDAIVQLEDSVVSEVQRRFRKAWDQYVRDAGAA